jgi:hypothetical protein
LIRKQNEAMVEGWRSVRVWGNDDDGMCWGGGKENLQNDDKKLCKDGEKNFALAQLWLSHRCAALVQIVALTKNDHDNMHYNDRVPHHDDARYAAARVVVIVIAGLRACCLISHSGIRLRLQRVQRRCTPAVKSGANQL